MSDQAELDLPLSARTPSRWTVAASMASTLGMSVDDIDDLCLGVNEAVPVLTDVDEGQTGARLHVLSTFDSNSDPDR